LDLVVRIIVIITTVILEMSSTTQLLQQTVHYFLLIIIIIILQPRDLRLLAIIPIIITMRVLQLTVVKTNLPPNQITTIITPPIRTFHRLWRNTPQNNRMITITII